MSPVSWERGWHWPKWSRETIRHHLPSFVPTSKPSLPKYFHAMSCETFSKRHASILCALFSGLSYLITVHLVSINSDTALRVFLWGIWALVNIAAVATTDADLECCTVSGIALVSVMTLGFCTRAPEMPASTISCSFLVHRSYAHLRPLGRKQVNKLIRAGYYIFSSAVI